MIMAKVNWINFKQQGSGSKLKFGKVLQRLLQFIHDYNIMLSDIILKLFSSCLRLIKNTQFLILRFARIKFDVISDENKKPVKLSVIEPYSLSDGSIFNVGKTLFIVSSEN